MPACKAADVTTSSAGSADDVRMNYVSVCGCMCAHVQTCKHAVYTYECMHVCVHALMHCALGVCKHASINLRTYESMRQCVYACLPACLYVCMSVVQSICLSPRQRTAAGRRGKPIESTPLCLHPGRGHHPGGATQHEGHDAHPSGTGQADWHA